jgi:hypothetical protein
MFFKLKWAGNTKIISKQQDQSFFRVIICSLMEEREITR